MRTDQQASHMLNARGRASGAQGRPKRRLKRKRGGAKSLFRRPGRAYRGGRNTEQATIRGAAASSLNSANCPAIIVSSHCTAISPHCRTSVSTGAVGTSIGRGSSFEHIGPEQG